MKHTKLFFIVFLFSLNIFGQEKIKLIKEKNLTKVKESDVYHFRLEKTGQILDLWTYDLINFNSQITSYYWKINKKGEIKKYYKTIDHLNENNSKRIFNLINEFTSNKLSSQEEIENWQKGITDEEVYHFEFIEKNKKTSLTFSNIENQENIEEADLVCSFLNQLDKVVNWNERYKILIKKLPIGKYYNGSMFFLYKK